MKVTIIYDNEVWPREPEAEWGYAAYLKACSLPEYLAQKKSLVADWGFSCLVEAGGRKILFDTGARGAVFLHNLGILRIKPAELQEVFISHGHWDHTGGLKDFLSCNKATVYLPASCPPPVGAGKIIRSKGAWQIYENIYSTGELAGIEQSLVVKTERGLVVVVGCAHPGVGSILEAAAQFGKPLALIGGLHDFAEFELLNDLELVCPVHCTRFKTLIKSLYPEKCVEGGAGRVIEI